MLKRTATASLFGAVLLGAGVGGCSSNAEKENAISPAIQESALQAQSQINESKAQSLVGPKANAIRSAKQYLSMSGFSRDGLIQQLSSEAGDGYEIGDATFAVDSLNNDWNSEAVRSAKQYLNMSGFSCNGLIEQLSSSAGDKYTVSQATYGAQQAGACS